MSKNTADFYDVTVRGHVCFILEITDLNIFANYKDFMVTHTIITFFGACSYPEFLGFRILGRFVLENLQVGNTDDGKKVATALWRQYRRVILAGIEDLVWIPREEIEIGNGEEGRQEG